MRKLSKQIGVGLALCSCLCLGAMGARAENSSPKTTTAKTETAKGATKDASYALGKPETLSGTILIVNGQKDLLVLEGTNGIPYDFRVPNTAKIDVASNRGTLNDLSSDVNRMASVTFVPMSTGNIAKIVNLPEAS
ncbi:MAG: hypothetical protein WA857_20550 [Candidatus Acidiferrum sp.]